MIISSKAIVLSKIRFKESDLIVKCYTLSNGLVSLIVKGAFSSKKNKFKPAYFQPLSMLSIEIDFKKSRDLHYIKTLSLLHSYTSLQTNILKSTVIIFLSEILTMALKEEESNKGLFSYIETSLLWFDTVNKSSIFHHQFLIGLTKYIGVSPEVSSAHLPIFNLESGRYQSENLGRYCISGEKLILFNSILGTKFDEHNTNLKSSLQRQELLNMILLYFKLHLQGFKTPKSIVILNQVFN